MPLEIQSERTKYELKLGVATREAFGRALCRSWAARTKMWSSVTPIFPSRR